MKVVHLQLFAAVAAIGFVGTGALLMKAKAEKSELQRKLDEAEAKLKSPGKPAAQPAAPKGPKPPGEPSTGFAADRIRMLESNIKLLEASVGDLSKQLREANAKLKALGAPAADPYGKGATPPDLVVGGKEPPPPAEPWGASDDNDINEMATILKLNPEQKEEVRKVIREGQNEFETLLMEASKSGESDPIIIEKIGKQVSDKTYGRIDQMLFAEQKIKFREMMKQREEGIEPPPERPQPEKPQK